MFRIITNFSRVHTQILEKKAINMICRHMSNKVKGIKSSHTIPTDSDFCPRGDLSKRELELLAERGKELEEYNKRVVCIRKFVSMRNRNISLIPSEETPPMVTRE